MDMCGICVGYVWCDGYVWDICGVRYVWDMCGVRYANNLLKNPATKRLSGKKITTAWWLASNSINMPLVTKCHINKKKRRASHTQQKAGLHSKNWPLPTASQLHIFARRNLLSPCFCNFNSGTRVSGKTRMVPKSSKLTTACRLPSNSKNMPLTMKCQINTEKSQFFRNTTQNWITSQSEKKSCPNTNLDRLGKTGEYLQLRSFTAFVGPFSGPVS